MIQQYIKGISIEEVRNNLKELSNEEIIEECIIHELFELLPRDENGICTYDANLDISEKYFNKLPDNLTINGYLICCSNELTNLPKKLIVNGDFDCGYNNLTSLPNDLKVYGDIYCNDNNLTTITNNINGGLFCRFNFLTTLPDNLIINGDLYCSDQKNGIKLKLPKTAVVKGEFIN